MIDGNTEHYSIVKSNDNKTSEKRKPNMIVMKFGGTSIQDKSSIERVAEIISRHRDFHPVVVNSAMGKTTRTLLGMARSAAAGMEDDALKILDDINQYHTNMAKSLISNYSDSNVAGILNQYFLELGKLLNGLTILRELSLRTQDKILAYGELIATAIVSAVLQERGLNVKLCDARKLIITDERFSRAEPILDLTYQRIYESVHPIVESNAIPVIQGFIGATRDGVTTTLGFEGSDFTTALVGAALNAAHIQIWKDVNGIMTADPTIYSEARTVKTISFAEAAALTFYGAKVLHPSTIAPARHKNIPVHIFNSKQPDATGTVITEQARHGSTLIKSIAYKHPVSIVTARSNQSVPSWRLLQGIFEIFERENTTPYVVAMSESRVALAISPSDTMEHLIDHLKNVGQVDILPGKVSVSLVGENLSTVDECIATVCRNLEGIHIDMISHGASPINVTLVINENDLSSVIARLHEAFFTDLDSEIFE